MNDSIREGTGLVIREWKRVTGKRIRWYVAPTRKKKVKFRRFSRNGSTKGEVGVCLIDVQIGRTTSDVLVPSSSLDVFDLSVEAVGQLRREK